MKKIILFTIMIITCCFVSAETFEYTPNFPNVYTAREVALADNYVADYSTYFSVWANPANAGLTGNKIMLPFISLEMYTDIELAQATRNIDVIVGGHSHTFIKDLTKVRNLDRKKVVVVTDGKWGFDIGKLTVK